MRAYGNISPAEEERRNLGEVKKVRAYWIRAGIIGVKEMKNEFGTDSHNE